MSTFTNFKQWNSVLNWNFNQWRRPPGSSLIRLLFLNGRRQPAGEHYPYKLHEGYPDTDPYKNLRARIDLLLELLEAAFLPDVDVARLGRAALGLCRGVGPLPRGVAAAPWHGLVARIRPLPVGRPVHSAALQLHLHVRPGHLVDVRGRVVVHRSFEALLHDHLEVALEDGGGDADGELDDEDDQKGDGEGDEELVGLADRAEAAEERDEEHDGACDNQDDRGCDNAALHEVLVFADVGEDDGSCCDYSDSGYLQGEVV